MPLGAFGDAGYILSAAGLIPSLWRPSAIWHCCGAAPAEGAALAVNDEEWLLQQHGVPPSPAGGENPGRAPRGSAKPDLNFCHADFCLAEETVVGGPDSS